MLVRPTAAVALGVVACGAVIASFCTSAGSRAAGPAPGVCTAAETRSAVSAFVRAFNRGDNPRLNRVWARRGDFQWYTTVQREPRIAHAVFSRARLLPYFAARHRQRERLAVVRFRFNGTSGGYGHFEYRLECEALDLNAENRVYDGKGAVTCARRPAALAVWSMGTA
jgi:hypothetical protein